MTTTTTVERKKVDGLIEAVEDLLECLEVEKQPSPNEIKCMVDVRAALLRLRWD